MPIAPALEIGDKDKRRLKGWSRAKKQALVRGAYEALPALSSRARVDPSRRPPEPVEGGAPQDEGLEDER